jgi:hypothetical protein
MELQAVLSCFPLVWDDRTLLAITICFAVQCEVDDLIEEMGVGLVRECLTGHQKKLRGCGVIEAPQVAGKLTSSACKYKLTQIASQCRFDADREDPSHAE